MARSPSLPLGEYDELSSPDPLASSKQNDDYRSVTRLPSPAKYSFSSPSKRGSGGVSMSATPPRTSRSQWINTNSPSKTVTEQTLSPWKIRVTVETEPEVASEGSGMPASRTMMVPLRDASSPMESRTRSSRGRISQPGTAKSKRSATPVRKRAGSKTRRQSVTDLDIIVLGDEGDSNDWTKRKSPKKRKSTTSRSKKSENAQQLENKDVAGTKDSTGRNTKLSAKIAIREDTDASDDAGLDAEIASDSPELRSIDLNRVSVRSRSISSKQRKPLSTNEEAETPAIAPLDCSGSLEKSRRVSGTHYPTPDPSVQDEQDIDEPVHPHPRDSEGFDTILESEGFTMIDLDSLPSARQFTKSPSETLAAKETPQPAEKVQNFASLPPTQSLQQAKSHEIHSSKPNAIPAYLATLEGDSDISSNVPSSPPVLPQPTSQPTTHRSPTESRPREVTPLPYSSPKLPSPPKAVGPTGTMDAVPIRKSAPTLVKVVKAGIALQGVLSPRSSKNTVRNPTGTPKERLDNIFEGFDSGTRRELRAGLRFGEELAKRQRSNLDEKESSDREISQRTKSAKESHLQPYSGAQLPPTQVWRGETTVQHSPITMSNESRQNNSVQKLLNDSEGTVARQQFKRSLLCNETRLTDSTSDLGFESQFAIDSQKEREAQWERERQAVSSEIENASSSQVVIIDSDKEDEHGLATEEFQGGQDDTDIWCEEAASCDQRSSARNSRPLRTERDVSLPQSKLLSPRDRSQEKALKPRRSVLPAAWRQNEPAADESTYLTNGDMTGLFYHEPKSKIKFGAAEIDRQRKQFSSGSLEIDGVPGSRQNVPPKDSQVSEIDNESVKSTKSDAGQLQLELSISQAHYGAATSISPKLSSQAALEQSVNEDTELRDDEATSTLMERDSSPATAPQPMKIPVNFNDSTVSDVAAQWSRSSPSTEPELSRPSTPRSAMKGGRQSFGITDASLPALRKVGFSTHETRVSPEGEEEERSIQSVSSSPEIVEFVAVEGAQPSQLGKTRVDPPNQKTGILGWFLGGNTEEESTSSPRADGQIRQDQDWEKTRTSISQELPEVRHAALRTHTPSYLLPPSYPSDPTRDTETPMSTSGSFTNSHFRTLHIIYAKSLRPRFHAPKVGEVRPELLKLLNTSFEADESRSGLGVFEWKVDEAALRVLERFMREIEWGHPDTQNVKWGWTEREICDKLFRLVVGEEVRKEEKLARERAAPL